MDTKNKKDKKRVALFLSILLLLTSFSGLGFSKATDEKSYEKNEAVESVILQGENQDEKTPEPKEELPKDEAPVVEEKPTEEALAETKDNELKESEVLPEESKDALLKEESKEVKEEIKATEEKPASEVKTEVVEEETEGIIKEETEFIGSNPDHLVPPFAKPSGKIDYNIYPETDFPINSDQPVRTNLSRDASAAETPSTGIIGEHHPQNPGDVMLFKEAKAVPGKVNTWDVTLRIEGKDTTKTSDVVLVIDRSGSMKGERMKAAIDAAKAFIYKLLPSDTTSHTTRIAVVSFASDVRIDYELTNDAAKLYTAIDGLSANGGTFTQAGIKQAEAILKNSNADNKHIVLLSDGEPTFNYVINNPDNYLVEGGPPGYYYNPRQTSDSVPEEAFNYNSSTGTGSSMWYRYGGGQVSGGKYYNSGNAAISQAKIAYDKGYNVFTIGLQTNTTGSGVLDNMKQGSGTFTEVTDVNQLTPVFEAIAGQIASAAKNATVSDPMGQGFTIPGGATNIVSIPETPAAEYDPATKKITWNPGTLTTPIEPGSDIKYAQIKYRIEINDDILDAENEGGKYATNGDAQVTYTDANGVEQTVRFPKPMVDPVLWIVDKQIKDHEDNIITTEKGEFGIKATNYKDGGVDDEGKHILGEQIPDYNYTDIIKMATRSGRKLITNLRNEGYYKIEETSKSFGEAVELDWESLPVTAQYTFKFGEVGEPGQPGYIEADKGYNPISDKYKDKQAFWIHNDAKGLDSQDYSNRLASQKSGNGLASQDVSIRITSKLKPIDIVINKGWDPKKPDEVEEGIKFVITREIDGKVEEVKTVNYTEFTNDEYKLKKQPRLDNNGKRYIYKVEEVLPANSKYESVASSNNPSEKKDFEVEKEVTFEFTNRVKIDIPVEKTWVDENNKYQSRPESITVQLYKDDKPIEGKILELKVSDKPDENWKGIFKEMSYKENGEVVKYSVKEVEVPTGYKEEVTGNSLEGFTIKNTLQYSQVKLKKTVSGNMYDSTSEYKFTYVIVKDGVDGPLQSGSITLKKDGLSDPITVPVGYKLVFNEVIEGFELKPTVTWQGGEENTTEYTWENEEASEEPVEIVVNNDFTVEIPTGVTNPNGPIFVALGLAVAGLGYYLFTRKKRNLEI